MEYLYNSSCLHPVGEYKGQLRGVKVPSYNPASPTEWYKWVVDNRHSQALIYDDETVGVEQARLVRDLFRQYDNRPMIIRRLTELKNDSQLYESRVMGVDGLVSPHSDKFQDPTFVALVKESGLHMLKDGPSLEGESISISINEPHEPTPAAPLPPIVKICGLRSVEAAVTAMEAGADMLGMILVPGRARTVNFDVAREIASLVRSGKYKKPSGGRPQLVGVFRNQPLAYILSCVQDLNLDIVQLHGDEPLEWCRQIPVEVIKRVSPGKRDFRQSLVAGYQGYSLLDSEAGGEGTLVDWTSAERFYDSQVRFILAGGLTPENVSEAVRVKGVIGVDVSGGVETDGEKDLEKIRLFVKNARD